MLISVGLLGCTTIPSDSPSNQPLNNSNQNDEIVSSEEVEDSLGCDGGCETLFKKLKKFARNGSPHAQTMLAVSYRTGESEVPKNATQAWRWIKRAVRQRHAPAMHIKSMWHREGYAEPVNIERADWYLQRAADTNYAPAILDLAILNFQRHQNKEGLRLLTKVADMGYPRATELMSKIKKPAPKESKKELAQNTGKSSDKKLPQGEQRQAEGVHSEGEVITIVADEVDPVELFAEMIDMIRNMKIYNQRGTTGSRISDRKCGQPGSGCRIEGPPTIP